MFGIITLVDFLEMSKSQCSLPEWNVMIFFWKLMGSFKGEARNEELG